MGMYQVVFLTVWRCLISVTFWQKSKLSPFCSPVVPHKDQATVQREDTHSVSVTGVQSVKYLKVNFKSFYLQILESLMAFERWLLLKVSLGVFSVFLPWCLERYRELSLECSTTLLNERVLVVGVLCAVNASVWKCFILKRHAFLFTDSLKLCFWKHICKQIGLKRTFGFFFSCYAIISQFILRVVTWLLIHILVPTKTSLVLTLNFKNPCPKAPNPQRPWPEGPLLLVDSCQLIHWGFQGWRLERGSLGHSLL